MRCWIGIGVWLVVVGFGAEERGLAMEKGKPVEVKIKSSVDGTEQPNIIQVPTDCDGSKALPLLVGLHSWSADYKQQVKAMALRALKRGWLLVLPNFRGPNLPKNPNPKQACASLLAQHDIIDSVNYMIEHFNVDRRRIYLAGGSGGGHMSQMMAAKYPDLWAGVSAWCGISNIGVWHGENKGYAKGIEACAGGKPGASPEVDWECFRRSPVNLIRNARNTNLDIRHGHMDKSVPYHHSLDSFNELMKVKSERVTLTLFDGGHEFHVGEAFDWLSKQTKDDTPPTCLTLITDEAKPYYYATLVPAKAMRPGRCEIAIGEDGAIAIEADGLKELRLNREDMGLKKNEATLAVESTSGPFALCLDGIASPDVSCAKKAARTWEYDEKKRTLTISVAAEDVPIEYAIRF